LARLETVVARFQAEMAFRDLVIIEQLERIADLGRALEESRRGGKRQATPFSKGEAKQAPTRAGRERGIPMGCHGHPAAPAGPLGMTG
jgi:transposase